MFIFPYFRKHDVIVHGSNIKQRITIIIIGVVVRDVITYHEVNSLAGILLKILSLSSVMVFRSTASIWSIGKLLTISGVLFFGVSEAFSLMSSFTFGVPAKIVCALFLLNLKQ